MTKRNTKPAPRAHIRVTVPMNIGWLTSVSMVLAAVLPVRECFFGSDSNSGPLLATYRVKWNKQYREKWNIDFGFAMGIYEENARLAGLYDNRIKAAGGDKSVQVMKEELMNVEV